MIARKRQPLCNRYQKPRQLAGIEMARRTAAQEDRLNRLRLAQRGKFCAEGFDVEVDLMILAGGHGEVTVAAMVRAKRNVNIRGPRP